MAEYKRLKQNFSHTVGPNFALTVAAATTAVMSSANSCLNFFIYAARHPDFKRYLHMMLLGAEVCTRNQQTDMFPLGADDAQRQTRHSGYNAFVISTRLQLFPTYNPPPTQVVWCTDNLLFSAIYFKFVLVFCFTFATFPFRSLAL